MALAFTSCTKDPVAKEKEYVEKLVKLAEDGKADEFAKVAQECKEWEEGLSKEDKEALQEWMKSDEGIEAAGKLMGAAFQVAAKQMGGE